MKKTKVLVVDDEPEVLQGCGRILRRFAEATIVLEQDALAAVELLAKERFDILLTDLRMPHLGGRDLLLRARERDPEISVIVMTAFPTLDTAIACLKAGAVDYVTKPVDAEEFLGKLRRLVQERHLKQENQVLGRQAERAHVFADLVSVSPAMQAIKATLAKLAQANVDVLITGETGVGKEMVARSLHRSSDRAAARFVPVDCGAIPESLIESELFGHERGAYTGADAAKMGLVEFADRGTLFLDEVGELPISLQPKLLRTLQERRLRRIGGTDEIPVNIRVVAATNRDLAAMVREKQFREDLLYRVKVARIDVPPLRDRIEDIPLLVEHFARRGSPADEGAPPAAGTDVLDVLSRYPWPGNVRELQNVVRYALAMAQGRPLSPEHLPEEVVLAATLPASARGEAPRKGGGFFAQRDLHLDRFERTYFEALLASHKGDATRAAVEAELPRGTLYRLLKKHGLSPETYRR